MKRMSWMTAAATALVAAGTLGTVQTQAGLFKLDFGVAQNEVPLTNWDTLPDWSFTGFADGIATWTLTDFPTDNKTH